MKFTVKNLSQSGQQRHGRQGSGMARIRPWAQKCLTLFLCLAGLVSFSACSERLADLEEEELDPSSIEYILKKPNLKVLDIGNSYTNDATDLLPIVVENSGVDIGDMCLYRFLRGSASFSTWCKVYNDQDTESYSFSRSFGSIRVPTSSGFYPAKDGSVFRKVLSEVEWDLIIIHQVSTYAPYYDLWKGDGAGGDLDELLGIIKKHQPKAKIGFLLIHSYWDNYSGNEEKSSFERWQKIAESVQKLREDYDIQFIIPYGTAIENLRSSSLNNDYDLTRDGIHLGYGLSQYTAACCYYESLIMPRTGVSCYGTPAYIDVSDKESRYPIVNVTDKNALIAQKSAVLAVKDMFNCKNPENQLP